MKINHSNAVKDNPTKKTGSFFSKLYTASQALLSYLAIILGFRDAFSRSTKATIESEVSAADEQRRKHNLSQIGIDKKLKKKSLF